ncbi:lysoplasmalogenase family protein [Acidovorax sp. MR-S7]|uniref:lysoplasmalogenase family protein n=1 Tax=Acidovorax sp. MR-S7 TaxID=1268622 RepID=UPI000380FBEF|nr:lysoplasmalogenase family protein [Acidovorax sp. MR-S7]GAD22772.1 predicted membrane protein [Acidovorax sp. MR-S7]
MPVFAPAMPRALRGFASLRFVLRLAGVAAFLRQAEGARLAATAIWFAVLLACQWTLGAAMQGRIVPWEALMVEAGALATATSALQLEEWHLPLKPIAMALAIVFEASSARQQSARSFSYLKSPYPLLPGARLASLAGDVCLMLPGLFIARLASLLLAYLCYIALPRRGMAWMAHRPALAATLALGACVYAFLWQGGLPAALRLPVAAYVALGACCFMLNDTVLAASRLVYPLPHAQFRVLATYYAAQALIVGGVLRGVSRLDPAGLRGG